MKWQQKFLENNFLLYSIMESTVSLKIEVTVEPGTKVYKFDEKMNFIDELTVLETHIVKVPWMDEYRNRKFSSCLDKQSPLKPSYVELVVCESAEYKEPLRLPLSAVWLTPEEAMEAYSKEKLKIFNKK